ncbi:competence protein ComK [Sporolactobacillus terrae]|uniref:competence protein ComK n=1 Tax=Sporolactobacillus terrae TaxID=269673 RepID=UPI0011196450|nr:competence protein ComK [Sporolactobacillus terrae]
MKTEKNYIIRPETMALVPCELSDGDRGTLVIEESTQRYVKALPKTIVAQSCGYYGSTYSGRKKVAVEMGYKSMPPICVCGELGIVFLSSMTERSDTCAWLSFSHVRQWSDNEQKGSVAVMLSRGKHIELPMHARPFGGRVMRAMQYAHQLRERMTVYDDAESSKTNDEPKRFGFKENGTFYIVDSVREDE